MRLRCLLALGLGLLATPAFAHPPDNEAHETGRHHGPVAVPEGVRVPAWSELGPDQQRKLAHLADQWDSLPASRRVHALERLERHARWEAMTPEQRQRLRAGARNFHDLPPELREKLRESMRVVHALPEAERRQLFERWRSLSPEQRRAWLEVGGPGIAPEPAAKP